MTVTTRATNAISQAMRSFRTTHAPTVTRSHFTACGQSWELATLARLGARTEVYRVDASGLAMFAGYADALRLADHDLRAALFWAVRRHRDNAKAAGGLS